MSVPLVTGAAVQQLAAGGGRFQLHTKAGSWRAHAVVVATGTCCTPFRPPVAAALDPRLYQIDAAHYRRPGDLPSGGVLVVGASASGVQLAEEIQASGRAVTLAVGDHLGAPRRYRGRDFYQWLGALGVLAEPVSEPSHREALLRQPSLQLIGTARNREISLTTLMSQGVRLTGRLCGATGRRTEFDGSLEAAVRLAQVRKLGMLDRLDHAIERGGGAVEAADPGARRPAIARREAEALDLFDRGIRSVVWATGYVRSYPWLELPVKDGRGELVHDQGALPVSGLFAMGLNLLRRRQSSFIGGCGQDAEDLAPSILAHLDGVRRRAA